MDEIKQLKSVLRSLVVSSPVQITLATLLRDYRNMMGENLPIQKYGYRDPLQFLKERCGDCFLGFGTNTVLTPIVPECLKHIDDFVQKQNVSSKIKFKGKRRSVRESYVAPAPDLIAKTFDASPKGRPVLRTPVEEKQTPTPHSNKPDNTPSPAIGHSIRTEDKPSTINKNRPSDTKLQPPSRNTIVDSINKNKSTLKMNEHDKENEQKDSVLPSKEAYKNFLRKRLPVYESSQHLDKDSDSGKCTSDSEQHTISSCSSGSRAAQLEELKAELVRIVQDSPDGVCCTDLMKLYRERYGRELNFSRFGFLSVSALACSLAVHVSRDVTGGVRLSAAPPPAPRPRAAPRPLSRAAEHRALAHTADDEDALPWIDFDPDVFPADCLSFSESIPAARLEGAGRGAMLEVMVGEVYSPSHFWFYRLGEQHHIAMEDMMDKMTTYYSTGEGAKRTLAVGAVRVGHYCSSVYERDWHRSLIVNIVDSDTVKVRHIDYGTVDRVPVSGLKPLLRCWATLPAQALRARLAGARPAARGRRWPHAAAAAFLRLVQDRRLVANVVSQDPEENIVEVFLIDTSTERDVRIDLELIRAGHADPCAEAHAHALAASYLYPRFDALESGATPNFADISAYLRDGIALEFVDDYSRHVPAALPPPCSPPPAPPAPRALDNRVPLALADLSVADAESVAPSEESDIEQDSLESSGEESPRVDATFTVADVRSESADSRPLTPLTPAVEPPETPEPEAEPEPKPECRAALRVPPGPPRHMGSQILSPLGAPLFAAPSMSSLPFFVFPPPAPMQPYPPYAHPGFRPYPSMEAFLSPPQRCFQPVRAPYCGPGYPPLYPPGPLPSYCPSPAYPYSQCSGYTRPVSNAPVTSTPKPFQFTAVSKPSPLPVQVSKPVMATSVLTSPLSPIQVSKPPVILTPISNQTVPVSNPSFVPTSVANQTVSVTKPLSLSTNPPLLPTPILNQTVSISKSPIMSTKSSLLPTPVSNQTVSVSKSPILSTNSLLPTPVSNQTAPVSKPPILSTNVSKPLVAAAACPAATASVAPTPVPRREPGGAGAGAGARRVSTGQGDVSLSVSECEIFSLLSAVDPNAAHWYIVDAISRAMATRPTRTLPADGGSRLNPEASEFRLPAAAEAARVARPAPPLRPPHSLRPPPGFGGD